MSPVMALVAVTMAVALRRDRSGEKTVADSSSTAQTTTLAVPRAFSARRYAPWGRGATCLVGVAIRVSPSRRRTHASTSFGEARQVGACCVGSNDEARGAQRIP